MADFATRLRELRKERGLRQMDVAKAFDIAQTTIANYEKKLRFPDEELLGRFADFFGVSLDFLLGRSAEQRSKDVPETTASTSPIPAAITEHAARYLELLRREGIVPAGSFVEELARTRLGIQRIYLEVLEPALCETGRLWERGELSVGEEHAISEATQNIMSRVFRDAESVSHAPARGRSLVVAAPGERHTIGSRMVADFLRLDGWEVVFVGGNLSTRHVLESLRTQRVDLLGLSVTMPEHLSAASDLIAAIREKRAFGGVRIIIGGQALRNRPELWRELGADGDGGSADAAAETAAMLFDPESGSP